MKELSTVMWFSDLMIQKLLTNREKRNWREYSNTHLLKCLLTEVGELAQAVATGSTPHVMDECADVANFAMMISDNAARQLPEEDPCRAP